MILSVLEIGIGLALIFWAAPLSVRYNAWTTGFRERNPHINRPPTPKMRALNTKIMTYIFRVAGGVLVVFAIALLFGRAISG